MNLLDNEHLFSLFQNRCSQVQLRSDKMEMEMMEARVYRTPELNGDLSEDEDAEGELDVVFFFQKLFCSDYYFYFVV